METHNIFLTWLSLLPLVALHLVCYKYSDECRLKFDDSLKMDQKWDSIRMPYSAEECSTPNVS